MSMIQFCEQARKGCLIGNLASVTVTQWMNGFEEDADFGFMIAAVEIGPKYITAMKSFL